MFQLQERQLSLRAIAFLIDGYSTLLHHFSTSFTLVALMMHMFPRDRALTAACVVPIMQHMFILVKYHAHTTYLVLELILEGWFQWEVREETPERENSARWWNASGGETREVDEWSWPVASM